MTPTKALLDRVATLLASDTTTLAPASLATKVHLAVAPFTPGPNLTPSSFTEASFTGYSALSAGTGTQQEFFDPATGNRIIQVLEPAGGWHWQATGSSGLPQTVYGYYITDNGGTTLYGSALLSSPVTLQSSGDGVDVGNVRFGLVPGALV